MWKIRHCNEYIYCIENLYPFIMSKWSMQTDHKSLEKAKDSSQEIQFTPTVINRTQQSLQASELVLVFLPIDIDFFSLFKVA